MHTHIRESHACLACSRPAATHTPPSPCHTTPFSALSSRAYPVPLSFASPSLPNSLSLRPRLVSLQRENKSVYNPSCHTPSQGSVSPSVAPIVLPVSTNVTLRTDHPLKFLAVRLLPMIVLSCALLVHFLTSHDLLTASPIHLLHLATFTNLILSRYPRTPFSSKLLRSIISFVRALHPPNLSLPSLCHPQPFQPIPHFQPRIIHCQPLLQLTQTK